MYPLRQQNYVSCIPSINQIVYLVSINKIMYLSIPLCQQNCVSCISCRQNYVHVSCIPFLDKIVSCIPFVNKLVYLISFSPIKLCLQYCFCQQNFHNFMFEILIFFFTTYFQIFFFNCLFVFQLSIDKSFLCFKQPLGTMTFVYTPDKLFVNKLSKIISTKDRKIISGCLQDS